MPDIRILTESDLRKLVPLDLTAVDCIEAAFVALAGGHVVMPPILSMPIKAHNGEIDVKTAYVPGLDSFAVKMSPGFFDNPSLGLPSTSGLMVLFSSQTGVLEALLLDNGYLTDVRTAAAGAVAARHLARQDATRAAIVGTGCQARLQLKALTLVRQIKSATIWGRDTAKAQAAANDMSQDLGIDVKATSNLEAAVRGADVIITTTPSHDPLLNAEWLQPGQHVTAMGSDQSGKQELQAEVIARADLYVPDRQSQTALLGELRSAISAGLVPADRKFPELGDVAAGTAPARTNDNEITVADLTGTGVQDTAIATLARQRGEDQRLGASFTS